MTKSKKTAIRPRAAGVTDVEIGRKIRMRRIELHMSQADLGTLLGVSFQQIQKYEKGTNRVSGSRLSEIAKALNVDLNYLIETPTTQQSELVSFMTDAASQRLLRAFHKIEDQGTRYKVVGLLEAITSEAA